MGYYKYCPKCGDITFIQKAIVCDFCNEPYIETNYEWHPDDWRSGKNIYKEILEEYVKPNPLFDEELYNKRVGVEKAQQQSTPQNVPKCPTCGSTKVHPISAGKKAAGFVMVGVFSKNFGKSYECDNCKYRW